MNIETKTVVTAAIGAAMLVAAFGAAQARPVKHPVVTQPLHELAPARGSMDPTTAMIRQETHPAPDSGSPLGTPGNGSPSNTEPDRD